MLFLNDIKKDYTAGDAVVHALRGVSIKFRRSEFVSVLGPSGCGKTTLLNIVGGLDQYTSGDLVINGRSTKDYNDNDWDSYRNHSIGFVFQSYNLIPHQSILQNVELALTLSGVSKEERRRRARQVLEKVGLGGEVRKKPNQLSGGQMQRVAIARALVNDPDILLADEPTGALDTETSVQIMELLKQVAQDRLVVMVTHNPDLAERYSTRIIRLLDGAVTGDTDPFDGQEDSSSAAAPGKKPQMTLKTAFSLSLNNLMTKKARTLLTAFAGSIGIIGIALILSLSNGIQTYIDKVQEDTLSSYPISIQSETVDMSTLVTTLMGSEDGDKQQHEKDAVYSSVVMYDLINSLTSMETETNNLKAFKEYLENNDEELSEYVSAVRYSYGFDFNVYTEDADGKIIKSDITKVMEQMMTKMYGGDYSSYFSTSYGSSISQMNVWEEMLADEDGGYVSELLQKQYDVLYGEWPSAYNEVVLIVDENNEISDVVLCSLGLKTDSEMSEELEAMMNGEQVDAAVQSWSYEEICAMKFKLVLPAECYTSEGSGGAYTDLSLTDTGIDYLYNAQNVGTELKISGIVRPNEDAVASMMTGAIGYTAALTDYIISRTEQQDIVKKQLDDSKTDVISGLPFKTDDEGPDDEEKAEAVKEYIQSLSETEKAAIYSDVSSRPTEEYLQQATEQAMSSMTRESIEEAVTAMYSQEMGVDTATVQDYIASMDDETLFGYVEESVRQRISEEYAAGVQQAMSAMTAAQLAAALDYGTFTGEQYVYMYDTYMPATVSDSTYEDNLDLLGYVDKTSPTQISIYAATFSDKDKIAAAISEYNASVSQEDEIQYTDYVALLMSSITTIINAISYVLIAFVAISLVVSSIMIGIITYISVLERTKEIGILRSIGASKKDVSRVFNAETVIEGLAAGIIGIGLTLLLTVPINLIVHKLTGIMSLNAVLPVAGGVILILISVVLTLIAGIIPSRLAAKKDPVVALRTE